MMNRQFYEFWGHCFINVAQGQKQFEEMSAWMKKGSSGSDDLTKLFRQCYGLGSKDTEDICLNTGHIGIYVSSKFQEKFAPKIAGWLKERDPIPRKRSPRRKSTAAPKAGATKRGPEDKIA